MEFKKVKVPAPFKDEDLPETVLTDWDFIPEIEVGSEVVLRKCKKCEIATYQSILILTPYRDQPVDFGKGRIIHTCIECGEMKITTA